MKKQCFLPLILAVVTIFSTASVTLGQNLYWHPTNGPLGGAIRDVAVDSSGGIWIATGRAGIYYSTDSAESWRAFSFGLPAIGTLAVAASNKGYIYAISINNERFYRLNTNIVGPQWRWESLYPDTVSGPYNMIVTDPNGYVYTNCYTDTHRDTIGARIIVRVGNSIKRSTDNGTTWNVYADGLKDSSVYAMAAGRKDEFCIITKYPLSSDPAFWVFMTHDDGATWTRLQSPIPAYSGVNSPLQVVIAANGNIVVSTAMKSGKILNDTSIYGGRIYTSTDNGQSWQKTYERPYNSEDGKNDIDKLVFVRETGTLYANAHGITIRSTDNGVHWITEDTNKRGDELFSMATQKDEQYVYQVCEPDGVFRSPDFGATYVDKFAGLHVEFLDGMAIDSKGNLFTISEYGLSHSYDNGANWSDPVEFGESYFPSIFIASNDHIYVASEFGVFRSTDHGLTLNHLFGGSPTIFREIGQTASGKLITYFTDNNGSQLLTSTNEGETWDTITNKLPEPVDVITRFATTSDSILIAGSGPSYYLSTNDGASWTTQTSTAACTQPVKMLFHTDGSVLALIPGSSAESGVWHSTDAGKSWFQIFPPVDNALPRIPKDYFSLDVDDAGTILVGTDSGVWRSDSHYSAWEMNSTGLNWGHYDSNMYINVSEIVENKVTHRYYAATRGLSVFESIPYLNDVKPEVVIAHGELQVYPDPAASTTSLSFNLTSDANVSIAVFDLLGRKVLSKPTGMLNSGRQTIPLDLSSLPNGAYQVVVTSDNNSMTSWLSVLK